jgi:hypothetical protein
MVVPRLFIYNAPQRRDRRSNAGAHMLKNVGIASGIGIVLGGLLVWWVRPDTGSGTALLMLAAILACNLVRAIFSAFSRGRPGLGGKP